MLVSFMADVRFGVEQTGESERAKYSSRTNASSPHELYSEEPEVIALVNQAVSGDPAAFALLYDRFAPAV